MKDFLKIVLASALGFVIANILFSIIAMIFFFGAIGSFLGSMSGGEKFILQDNTVLNLRLNGPITERTPEEDPFTSMMGSNRPLPMGLNDIVSAIRKAKNNDKIKGIYIDSRIMTASMATLAEIRHELENFKESGKFIVAYADTYTQGGYYLASVADKVAINPQGMLDLHGLASIPVFYKDALDKLGIEMQIFKVGTYKSAVEPFTQNEMSEANREQVSSFLNDAWSFLRSDLAESRSLTIADIDSLANNLPAVQSTDFLLSANLVDTLLYETEMKDYLRSLLDIDEDAKIPSATVANMKSVTTKTVKKTDNTIAILYAHGNIISGTGSSNIQDKYMVDQIEKLRKDKEIKAVVFRINSGGGSAYASEQIWKAITDLKAEKPVVVSMGDMAASGGYYIACNADKIVAQPTTLTGSIGVFGAIPSFEGTAKKLGISTDEVKTNEFSDFGNVIRPFNEREKQLLQSMVERGYDLFLTRCSEGRDMPKDSMALYAEGRVWTGNQAKEIGLVDELGGIERAIEIAAEMANLGKSYVVFEYPKLRSRFDELLNPRKEELVARTMKEYLGESYEMFMLLKDIKEQDYIQARIPYNLNIQ
ncbi:signal peptide peptidase A. Serine peptidase. MEROPS family S49 [Porphyromonadaceae bacterium NLAE-zl-C104]|uniref:signal peptide peptidase SppA n=1 Tax=Proteiniphilum sp. TaxID=1926877 RepID=UPI00089A00A5|nr:signal peptide peptidase SppA [Proteiniphilum sp.]MDY9918813.1 signal peptide peptidase SppA [Proteiniphilum sp.]SEA35748.1 signal peptide peptidase A. Serine peptidase. MEROPS family S49 [Porphyromonadaceae bacterium KH3R12]SFS52545.1 signal peptide peptidase A. Serine peptidase. MEROPS family S49 [Porphyromonadaceae bacterium NLAE-zl-C104]